MRRWDCWGLVGLVIGCTLGCAGSTPHPVAPGTDRPPAEAAPAERAELTPVAAPADLFARLRVKSPGALLDVLGHWLSLPLDWRGKLRDFAGDVDHVVAFDAPLEGAAVLGPRAHREPDALFAASLGLVSFDGALSFLREQGQTLERLPSGAYAVHFGDKLHCVVSRALGSVPARLICGNKARALDALAPYLAAGLPNEALSDSPIHVEILAEAFQHHFGKNLQMLKLGVPLVLRELDLGNPRVEAALSDVGYALADEVVAVATDLQQVSLDAGVPVSKEAASVSLSLKFKGQQSWTAQGIAQAGKNSITAPDMYWTLPKDATMAGYRAPLDQQRTEKLGIGLGELTQGVLDYVGVSARTRAATAAAVKQMFSVTGPWVYASGHTVESRSSHAPADAKARLATVKSAFGYYVAALDGDQGKSAELIRQLVTAYNEPGVAKTLKAKKIKADELPSVKPRGALAGLPVHNTLYEVTLPGKLLAKWLHTDVKVVTPVSVYVAVAQAGERAWLAVSMDRQMLSAKLHAVLKPDEGATLATREGLATLRSMPAVSAGFFTLRHFLDGRTFARHPSWSVSSQTLPHRGDVPVVDRATESSDGRELSWTVSIPSEFFEDIAAASVSALGGKAALVDAP